MSDCLPPVGWVQTGHGWRVWVTVTPNGKRSEWLYHENGQLRGLRLGAPATEGRANAELVRGVSDLYDLCREIDTPSVSVQRYGLLCQNTRRLFDTYHWLAGEQLAGLAPLLREIAATAELVLDEYEKVESIRKQSAQAMVDAESRHKTLLDSLLPDSWDQAQSFVDGLNGITAQDVLAEAFGWPRVLYGFVYCSSAMRTGNSVVQDGGEKIVFGEATNDPPAPRVRGMAHQRGTRA